MSESFTIRQATLSDITTIVTQRRKMFEEMGHTNPATHAAAEREFVLWARERLANGRFKSWLAETVNGQIIAGAGLWLQDWPPGYFDWSPYRGYIFSVYTEPDYRRKGLARQLIETALDWCAANGVRRVSLHYSDFGRTLYEAMGFEHGNEMLIQAKPAQPET